MRRVHKMTLLKSKLLLRRGLVKNVITQLFKWLLFHSTICFLKPAVQNVFLLKFACSLIGAVAAGSARLASRLAWEAMGGHRRRAVPPCHTAVPPPSSPWGRRSSLWSCSIRLQSRFRKPNALESVQNLAPRKGGPPLLAGLWRDAVTQAWSHRPGQIHYCWKHALWN